MGQLNQALRQGHSSRSGQTECNDQKITTPRDLLKTALLLDNDFTGQFKVAIATQPVHQLRAQQMPVRQHNRAVNRQLVGIENPEVLRGTAMEHQLAHRGARLPRPIMRTRSGKS